MEKKYKVNFKLGCVDYYYTTKKGNKLLSRFKIFTDFKGVYIMTQNGVEFLTEQNSEVM